MTKKRLWWHATISALPENRETWFVIESAVFRWRWMADFWIWWQEFKIDGNLAYDLWGTLLRWDIIAVDPEKVR